MSENIEGTKETNINEEVKTIVESITEEFLPVSKEQLELWKQEYGKVFLSEIAGDVFIWRRIRRSEYAAAMAIGEDIENVDERVYARQKEMTKMVTLYPLNIEEELENAGGLATELAENIIIKSGFHQTKLKQL